MKIFFASVLIAAAVTGCSGNGNDSQAPIPRRTAYARMNLPPHSYDTIRVGRHDLLVNRNADTSIERRGDNDWITATYPALGNVTMHVTVTQAKPDAIDAILDNRAERINLNLGGNRAETYEVSDSLLSVEIIVSRSIATPVQWIVTDSHSMVIHGSVYMPQLTSATRDSLAPITDYMLDDVINLISTLQ